MTKESKRITKNGPISNGVGGGVVGGGGVGVWGVGWGGFVVVFCFFCVWWGWGFCGLGGFGLVFLFLLLFGCCFGGVFSRQAAGKGQKQRGGKGAWPMARSFRAIRHNKTNTQKKTQQNTPTPTPRKTNLRLGK